MYNQETQEDTYNKKDPSIRPHPYTPKLNRPSQANKE
jgi:hypothetical protein